MNIKTSILQIEEKDAILRQFNIRSQAITQFATQILNNNGQNPGDFQTNVQNAFAACEMVEESLAKVKDIISGYMKTD